MTGSKANHLTYLGDSIVGRKVNIGAGTITCNYNGYEKSQTVIEDGAFIGSDTQLVAPVRVGKRAVVAAGTTVTADVPDGALAISRSTGGPARVRRSVGQAVSQPSRRRQALSGRARPPAAPPSI